MDIYKDEETGNIIIVTTPKSFKRLKKAVECYDAKLAYARNYYHKKVKNKKQYVSEELKPLLQGI